LLKTFFLSAYFKPFSKEHNSPPSCVFEVTCSTTKSLYDLKYAPRCWYKRFDSFVISLDYNIPSSNHSTYYKRFDDNDVIILLLYVDDKLVVCPNKYQVKELKAQLVREFNMKDLGLANKILGMQIHQDRKDRKVCLS
jgi:hypothetical protein